MTSIELFYSSDDESIEEEIVKISKIRRCLRDNSNPMDLDDKSFIKHFRLSKLAFRYVLESIEDKLKVIKRERAVPNIIKLAAALKFFAYGSYQTSVGNDFNIGLAQSTVSEILKDVFNILETHICTKWIDFEYTEQEQHNAAIYFYEKCGIPNITGCIDGTHIKIMCPKKEIRHLYYNTKGFYSVNAMIVCDHLMNIRYINSKNPGAIHDANFWSISDLKKKIHHNYCNKLNNVLLLGDVDYTLSPYLLTPYRNAAEGSLQARFNSKHSQGRNVIEQTIRLLKSRFRCLLPVRELHYSPEKAAQITNICAALHNICLKYNVESPEIENEKERNYNMEERVEDIGNMEMSNILFNEGSLMRDKILNLM